MWLRRVPFCWEGIHLQWASVSSRSGLTGQHVLIFLLLCKSRKYLYSLHRRNWNFLGVGKLYLNFQRGGGGLRENPFCGGGMDTFWSYTFQRKRTVKLHILCVNNSSLLCCLPGLIFNYFQGGYGRK